MYYAASGPGLPIHFTCAMSAPPFNTDETDFLTANRNNGTAAATQSNPHPTTLVDARNSTFNEFRSTGSDTNKEILDSLEPATARNGHYVPPCMEGTRENILWEIDAWLQDVEAKNILWIKGSPGSGKSTLASSLISRLFKRGRLGSSFAFKRGDITLSDPAVVWRTIAHDLARYDALFASVLVKVLRSGTVDPGRPDIASHFRSLVGEPLTKRHRDSPSDTIPVIVIDALDECGSDPAQVEQRRALLNTFMHWSRLPRTFKLIITGRDDRVPEFLRTICKQIELPTGSEVSTDANSDVRLFFRRRFAEISSANNWPSNEILDTLTTRAGGLFVWANTVVNFVGQGLPCDQLDLVLGGDLGDEDNVTQLYRQILELSFRGIRGRTLDVFNLVVSTILLAKIPLYVVDLPRFTAEPQPSVNFILDKLSSVISIGSDDKIRIQHLSFAEFICDPRRCPQEFYIDCSKASQKMSMMCFQLMRDGLRFNICDLKTSHLPNKNVSDLPERITEKIRDPLLYSCHFWAAHIQDMPAGRDDNAALILEIQDFMHFRFLYWLEVMSVTEQVPAAIRGLLAAANWMQQFDRKTSEFIYSGSQFIVDFLVPITTSAPHIYVSALPLSSKDSLLANHYRPQFPNILTLLSGLDFTSSSCVNVLLGHTDSVRSVVFSPDGKQLASGSDDSAIRVWDARTGEMLSSPFEGHMGAVLSVAFSPDGKLLASGSDDKFIYIWDPQTGGMHAGPFQGHTNHVRSVAFSPDGKQLASGSADKSICIWDVATGQVLAGPLDGHTDSVESVAFSPDGKQLASGSHDKSICIWDTITGKILAGPLKGHGMGYVKSVAFSPDSKWLVSGSDDESIRVWDVGTGEMLAGPFGGHTDDVVSVTFSPNGKWIASGSEDDSVCIWDAKTGEICAGPFKDHTDCVLSVAFSPDGRQLVSASSDKSIRIWNVNTSTENSKILDKLFEGHAGYVRSVTFSHDGKRLASGSDDKSICVWDTETGKLLVGPLNGHTDYIRSVAFSPDSKQVASGSDDKCICIWDSATGELLVGPFIAHRDYVRSITFSPDGKLLASGSDDKSICVWDPKTGKILAGPFQGHTKYVRSIAFSPNGQWLASGSADKTICIWNVSTGTMIAGPIEGHTDSVESVAFSPDGMQLASGSNDKSICIWNTETGELLLGPFGDHTGCVGSVMFSPDGKWVVSGSEDKSICIWDTQSGKICAGPFKGHVDGVLSVSFSPDGKRLASGSADRSIRIWDIKAGENMMLNSCRHSNTVKFIGGACTLTCFSSLQKFEYVRQQVDKGWVCSSDLMSIPGRQPALIFWVPYSYRKGLCGIDTSLVLGAHTTRLDLSQFVHGPSWTECYSPNQTPMDLNFPTMAQNQKLSHLPNIITCNLKRIQVISSHIIQCIQNWDTSHLQHIAFVLLLSLVIYYYHMG